MISAYSPGILHFILIWNKMFDLYTKFTHCLCVKMRSYQDLFNWYCLSWSIQSDILFLIRIKCLTFIQKNSHCLRVKIRSYQDLFNWYCLSWSIQSEKLSCKFWYPPHLILFWNIMITSLILCLLFFTMSSYSPKKVSLNIYFVLTA